MSLLLAKFTENSNTAKPKIQVQEPYNKVVNMLRRGGFPPEATADLGRFVKPIYLGSFSVVLISNNDQECVKSSCRKKFCTLPVLHFSEIFRKGKKPAVENQ
jgi:hypothetical protein